MQATPSPANQQPANPQQGSQQAAEPTSSGLRFVLLTIGWLLAYNTVSSIYTLGPKAITINTAFVLALDMLWAWRKNDRLMWGWIVFGVAAGFAELVADWWLVGTGTLVYPQDELHLWASPAYMPFAWTMVLVQVGYIGSYLGRRMPLVRATIATAVLAGINIPIYEHLADGAGWWFYQNTPMLFDAPYYVILAEFLLAAPLVWMGQKIARGGAASWIVLGLVEGVVMLIAVMVAFPVVGPCAGALIQLACGGS